MEWEELGWVVGVLSPLVGVPLTVITMYLRAIREHQAASMAEVTQRITAMENSIRDVLRCTADFEREYATKEEWVRESMIARQGLERLTELVTRIGAELDSSQGVAAELGRATASLVEIIRTMAVERTQPACREQDGAAWGVHREG